MYIGVDLLWVRTGICGGTESFIRNLLDGFAKYDSENNYLLFVSEDNKDSFKHYAENDNMGLHVCHVRSKSQPVRILWENFMLDKTAVKCKVEAMFIPVYSKPRTKGRIPYVTVIHDLQALHYPQYFSWLKRMFLKHAWKNTCKTSSMVLTDSDYCRDDLKRNYPFAGDKIRTLYVPIAASWRVTDDCGKILEKFGLKKGEYDYCVSALLPHKNLLTVLKALGKLKKQGRGKKLVLSGVGGDEASFEDTVLELGIEDLVIKTGFVTNEERDCLYENCRLFLFPSIFEGFGMPPIEAMRKGKRVVMTKESCLYEVTEGRAFYVDDAFDADEWIEKMDAALRSTEEIQKFDKYSPQNIVRQYGEIFAKVTPADGSYSCSDTLPLGQKRSGT